MQPKLWQTGKTYKEKKNIERYDKGAGRTQSKQTLCYCSVALLYKNIVMTCDNTKWTSASEVNQLVYPDDGWTRAETYVE
jgi:hypothetical protein